LHCWSLLVLAMAGMAIAGHRRRDREHRDHLRAMREREQRLRLSLWASNEIYWQYDLEKRELERTRVEPDRSDDLAVQVDLDKDHQIHEEDLPLVLERLREYVTGGTPMFISEHRILGEGGQWQWMRARGRAVARDASRPGDPHRRHRAQRHLDPREGTRAPHRQRGDAQHGRVGGGGGCRSSASSRSTRPSPA
jgi:PAS domain-containing protein